MDIESFEISLGDNCINISTIPFNDIVCSKKVYIPRNLDFEITSSIGDMFIFRTGNDFYAYLFCRKTVSLKLIYHFYDMKYVSILTSTSGKYKLVTWKYDSKQICYKLLNTNGDMETLNNIHIDMKWVNIKTLENGLLAVYSSASHKKLHTDYGDYEEHGPLRLYDEYGNGLGEVMCELRISDIFAISKDSLYIYHEDQGFSIYDYKSLKLKCRYPKTSLTVAKSINYTKIVDITGCKFRIFCENINDFDNALVCKYRLSSLGHTDFLIPNIEMRRNFLKSLCNILFLDINLIYSIFEYLNMTPIISSSYYIEDSSIDRKYYLSCLY